MIKRFLYALTLSLMVAGCCWPEAGTPKLMQLASFPLGQSAELRLLGDGNLSQLELYYGGELQELVGTANTDYVRNDDGGIALDTIADSAVAIAYVVRTFDRSSTYGAEVWYVVYPYRTADPDGPWNIAKVADERPTLQSVKQYIR